MLANTDRLNIAFGSKCNFNCSYCFEKDTYKTDYEINKNFYPYVINYLQSHRKCTAILFGGEPLIYWDKFIPIIEQVYRTNPIVIVTNGSMLTDNILNTINKYNIILNISIDYPINNQRSFDISLNDTIMRLVSKANLLALSSVLNNIEDIAKFKDYMDKKLNRKDYNIFATYPMLEDTPAQINPDNIIQTYKKQRVLNKVLPVKSLKLPVYKTMSHISYNACSDLKLRTLYTDDIIGDITNKGIEYNVEKVKNFMIKQYKKCPNFLCTWRKNQDKLCGCYCTYSYYDCLRRKNMRHFYGANLGYNGKITYNHE